MAWVALGLYVAYLALAFGLRTALQLRRTGSSGFRGLSGRPGSAEWSGGVLFVVALLLGLAAPVLALLEVVEPVAALDGPVAHLAGVVLTVGGMAATVAAQEPMGSSWRIGVDESERTALVTTGAFALVRNPIFSAMVVTAVGLALIVPSVVALAGLAALVVGLEVHTRLVEEPYLLHAHGRRYADYAARVGRFLPRVGTLPAQRSERLRSR